jgi:hypothetical protein
MANETVSAETDELDQLARKLTADGLLLQGSTAADTPLSKLLPVPMAPSPLQMSQNLNLSNQVTTARMQRLLTEIGGTMNYYGRFVQQVSTSKPAIDQNGADQIKSIAKSVPTVQPPPAGPDLQPLPKSPTDWHIPEAPKVSE